MLERACIHALMLQHVQHDARIERAATRSHWQTIQRRKARRRGDAAPVLDRAHAGTVAEMCDDGAAADGFRRNRRQHRDDVFVGKSMEAVATHACLGDLGRQCKALRERRLVVVKRRVERAPT